MAAALGNEQSARKAERRAAASAIVDLAIRHGIKTVAERAGVIEALANSADFKKSADDLLRTPPTHTTTVNGRDISGKQLATLENDQANALREYNELFVKELPLAGQDPIKAHQTVMSRYPGLADKLRPGKS